MDGDNWEPVILERGDEWFREAEVMRGENEVDVLTPLSEITFQRTFSTKFNLPVFRQTSERMVNHR